ncbi:hypothetical protein C5L31_000050 [Secundilactobacillus malefermentans]|uniref:PDZ domain-containing protein n=2 Tax=Secundilactobacillus malefermentans TaxID=176292 RepID=A0A4R5NIJ0_9LACO|nr:trypsin-like serine protease [Secundilactobacillus malefermentans DSM 5705 = KCTC 3548]TDG74403.1 hypothetical protein C5L31_000050 [Secundilactobacillus malefermentans]
MDNNNNENQNLDNQDQPTRAKRGGGMLTKVAITALIAGLLGGGIAYGGMTYFNNHVNTTSVPSGSNSGGTASTSNVKVNVSSKSETAFKNVKGAVVSVINLQKESSSSDGLGSLFGESSSESSSSSSSSLEESSEGSGIVYKKSGNSAYIVTNNHVVSGSNALEVITSSGKKKEAKIVGKDSVTDLAVIKVNSSDINKVATFGDSSAIKVGETALAIGSPLGSEYATSLTQGIISAKKRTVETTNGTATVIQTDAAINPGNSGGPLINLGGQVIGINSMKLASDSSGTSVEGMGFAIPSNEVVKIINQLIKSGKITRPALGIKYVDLSEISKTQQKSTLKLPSSVSYGAVVMAAPSSNSPASKAGIKKYDVITALGSKKVTENTTLRDLLYNYKVGDKVKVTYYHNGNKKTETVTLNKTAS